MIVQIGYFSLLITLIVAAFTFGLAIQGSRQKQDRVIMGSMFGLFLTCITLSISAFCLTYAFVTHDFSVKYVAHYSNTTLPLFYTITSLWGGQDGSLLFWVWLYSIFAVGAIVANRHRNLPFLGYTIAVFMSITIFFMVIIILVANPFQMFHVEIPNDGKGLNPLLQNPYMAIHPPMMYIGYVGFAIPFAFGMAALITKRLDDEWILISRKLSLIPWVFLSAGLILGGLWAYEELGWGGYWAWDPVENAGLLPWITGTAFLHSIRIQERRDMLKVWNMVLVILTFLLTIIGTFLTRSGIVESVHSFAQSNIGYYFFTFIVIATIVSFGFLLARLKYLKSEHQLESLLSKEFAFLLNNWILLGAAFFVLIATIFPSLSAWLIGEKITVGPKFFNTWMVPIGLTILFLSGFAPLVSWKKTPIPVLFRQFFFPSISFIITLIIIIILDSDHILSAFTFALCVFVVAGIIQEYYQGIKIKKKTKDINVFDAIISLIVKGKRRYVGYIIHFGIALMFLGFAGNSYNHEIEMPLKPGQKVTVKDYIITYHEMTTHESPHKVEFSAKLSVQKENQSKIRTIFPQKWLYRGQEEQMTTEVVIQSSLFEDLYVVLAGFSDQSDIVNFKFIVNPLVSWVWIGTLVLIFGTIILLWPERSRNIASTERNRIS